MANRFHLIDLVSQREAVREHLQGFTEEEMLTWLSTHGHLVDLSSEMPTSTHKPYSFTSTLGIEVCFFWRNGQMIFIGDHCTFV